MRPVYCAIVSLLLLMVLLQGAARAEAEDDAAAQTTGDEYVLDLGVLQVLGNRSLFNQLEDTRSITVIDGESMGGAHTIAEVLERVPGVSVQHSGGMGQLATLSIRGARAEQVLVLVDGSPVDLESVDLSLIPAGSLRQVEVLRGPGAARYGPGALGGVVNLVTYTPEEATAERYGIELTAGSHGLFAGVLRLQAEHYQLYFNHLQSRNSFPYTRSSGETVYRRNNAVDYQDLWLNWSQDGYSYRLGLAHHRRGVPGSAELPTLSAGLAQDGAWFQIRDEHWQADVNYGRTHFTDPLPAQGAAVDTLAHRLHAGFSWPVEPQEGWNFSLRSDLIDHGHYGEHSRAGLDITYNHTTTSHRLVSQLDLGLSATTGIAADPVAQWGLKYQLDAEQDLHASVGYAVRHPSFSELYYTDGGGVRGNPGLDSERLLSYELGYRYQRDNINLAATAFFTDYNDSIIWAPVSAYAVEATNTGGAEVAGVEALVDLQLAPDLWWRTAGMWLPHTELDNGLPLPGRSAEQLNSRLEYLGEDWEGALGLTYRGAMPVDLFGNLEVSERLEVDFEYFRNLGHGQLGVRVENLFDEPGRDSWNYPLPGRQIFVSWRIDL